MGRKSRKGAQAKASSKELLARASGRTPDDTGIYNSFLKASVGEASDNGIATKELHVQFIDFLDYEGLNTSMHLEEPEPVLTYLFNQNQELFSAAGGTGGGVPGQENVLCKVNRCQVFMYPRSVNALNATQSYAALTSVPVRSMQVEPSGEGFNAHQQSTVITPTFTPEWHQVADIDYIKLFGKGTILQQGEGDLLACFQLAVVNVDDLLPIFDQKFQVKIVLDVSQTIAPTVLVQANTAMVTEFSKMPTTLPSLNYLKMFAKIKQMTNIT